MTTVSLLGKSADIVGGEGDGYFQSFKTGAELADSVVLGVLPFVKSSGVCLDVGANLGLYSIALAGHFPDLSVYAFEPVPETFGFLAQNVAANQPRIIVEDWACGSTDEVAQMQFVDHFAAGSHFSVEGSIVKDLHQAQNVAVQVKRLDTVVDELGIDRVDLIKIDVEGFELDVLRGATRTLERFRPIVQLEFNGWTFMSHRRMLPQDVLDEMLETFPFVYVHARHGDRLARLSSPVDQHSLLYANAVHGGVDNLLCSFDELVPDAPAFAAIWPEFVETRDVQLVGLQRQVEALAAGQPVDAVAASELRRHVEALEAQIQESQAEIDRIHATLSWRITSPLRAVKARRKK